MSGGGSAPAAQPSTTTQVQDIPAWEQGYVTDLLGRAQAISEQPYQQFNGPQVAGFTDPQLQAFSNIEGSGAVNQANQAQAMGQATQGANTTNNIYGAGAGDINAASMYNPLAAVAPYLGAAAGYNSASAAQPWLNQASGYQSQAANAATPQGIQSYMSPYTNNVVQGLQNEANLNWNQNIMPGINDKFVGSGQYGSGRNAQVLGQAAGNFQTGLSANVANALESGYNTAGNQAATQAGILGNLGNSALTGANTASSAQGTQVSNLLNQANAAGTSTQQQAGNLLGQGQALGNLASTQGTQQLNAASTIGNLGAQDATTNLNQNTALQAVGQQQQQLNQTNLNTAMQNFQNQVNYPAQQTEYLNQIIRGLPAPAATTTSSQTTPAYSVSPLSGIGGSLASAAGLLGTGKKQGGIIKGYADGGLVDGEDDTAVPLDYASADYAPGVDYTDSLGASAPLDLANIPQQEASTPPAPLAALDTSDNRNNNVNPESPVGLTKSQMQQNELLALARGMLTPSLGGSTAAAFGQGLGNLQDVRTQEQQMMMNQANLNFQRQQEEKKLEMEGPLKAAQAKYYEAGAGAGNRMISVIDPNTGKSMLVTAREASEKGLSPTAGYNTTSVTLSPASIDMYAKAVASGAKGSDLGLGYGMNANKTAILNKVAEMNPNMDLAGVQTNLIGERAGARTVGTTSGKIEFASESLGSMIPLAKKASEDLDRTQYPTINAISNAVEKGTGDTKIIALNTYLNAVMSDQANLLVRGGLSTDAAREKAAQMANSALSKGQLNTYFDSVQNEIKAQREAGKGAMATFTHAKESPQGTSSSASNKIITQADIEETARNSKKTVDEVRKVAQAKGYTIQ